jgi:hypothetical protein
MKNAASKDWPKDVFDEAMRRGVLTKKGKLL